MADQAMHDWVPRVVRALVAVAVGAIAAGATIVIAIFSFDLNPVGPAVVALAAIVGGTMILRRSRDYLLRGAAIGLIAGGLLAVLLWPFFAVDSQSGEVVG